MRVCNRLLVRANQVELKLGKNINYWSDIYAVWIECPLWQLVSGASSRPKTTCSVYAILAYQQHGYVVYNAGWPNKYRISFMLRQKEK
jgi:hypothetical protein